MRLEVAKDERGLFVESDNTVLQISKSEYKRRPACIEFETDFGPISARHQICLSPKLARMVAEELWRLADGVTDHFNGTVKNSENIGES